MRYTGAVRFAQSVTQVVSVSQLDKQSESQAESTSQQRTPRQQRSRERVEAILNAAKQLIEEKGSAGLKIQDIAARAGVTASSMYQYFPNKAAIIHALAQHYLDKVNEMLQLALKEKPQTLEQCAQTLEFLFEQFHQLYCHDPVIRDIWVSTAADKNMQNMDIEDSRRNAALLFEHFRDVFPEAHWQRLERMLFLAMHLSGSTIRLALSVDQEEGHDLIAIAKHMISSSLMSSLEKTVLEDGSSDACLS